MVFLKSNMMWLALGMAMRIYMLIRIDADICIIRHMSDIARNMRIICG